MKENTRILWQRMIVVSLTIILIMAVSISMLTNNKPIAYAYNNASNQNELEVANFDNRIGNSGTPDGGWEIPGGGGGSGGSGGGGSTTAPDGSAKVGGIYSKSYNTKPAKNSDFGNMTSTDQIIKAKRLVHESQSASGHSLIDGHEAGQIFRTYEEYPQYLIRSWRYERYLNAPVQDTYYEYQVTKGSQAELGTRALKGVTETWDAYAEIGLGTASKSGLNLSGLSFINSLINSVASSLKVSFGYEVEYKLEDEVTAKEIVKNDTNENLWYRWQRRATMEYYLIQVFEYQYSTRVENYNDGVGGAKGTRYYYTDLGTMKYQEAVNSGKIVGNISSAIMPYRFDASGQYKIIGTFDEPHIKFV